jgi:hypothetical protein
MSEIKMVLMLKNRKSGAGNFEAVGEDLQREGIKKTLPGLLGCMQNFGRNE